MQVISLKKLSKFIIMPQNYTATKLKSNLKTFKFHELKNNKPLSFGRYFLSIKIKFNVENPRVKKMSQ